jgi:hypothetical protein
MKVTHAVRVWALLALGCAHEGASPGQQAPRNGRAEVQVGPGALKEGDLVLAAWLAYGVSKSELYAASTPPAANESADDFALELGAREAQCKFWTAQRHGQAHAAFDRQVEIWKAGFLPEMVLLVHGRPGWTVPANLVPSLKLKEFVERFAGDYAPGAPVALKPPSGKLVPDEPGADFPDPERFPIAPDSCRQGQDEREASWKRWHVLQAKLGGTPLSAASPVHFGQQVLASRDDPAYAGKALTWVSRRVAHFAMLEGYCAVELKDWPRAIDMLGRASALLPTDPGPRLELALALASVHRNHEALAHVDRVLKTENEGCAAALAWRRRGYVLYELGALEAARSAYETSLTLEPSSQIAHHELRSIAAEIERRAGSGAGGPPLPPPPSQLQHTRCEEGGHTRPRALQGEAPRGNP